MTALNCLSLQKLYPVSCIVIDLRFGILIACNFKNVLTHEKLVISEKNRGRVEKSTSELAREYLSRIDQKTFTDLIEVYRVDFEMFQYSPEGYYHY